MTKKDYIVYPAVIENVAGTYTLTFPDFKNTAISGKSLEEVFQLVPERLAATLTSYKGFPNPSSIEEIKAESSDDVMATYFGLDTGAVRRKMKDVTVRKNVTIPMSLANAAKEAGINFSETLTEALEKKLEN